MSGRHSIKRPGRARRIAGAGVVALAVLTAAGLFLVGANGPADPTLGGLPGFGEIAFRVTPAGAAMASSAQRCALLAETESQRAKGLMGRRDLGGFDAMVFRFDQDSTSSFHMRDVPVALSIAWFDAGGRFVSSTDMAPCPDQEGCPQYAPSGPYRVAVEVLQGGLDDLGIGAESTISVGGACTG